MSMSPGFEMGQQVGDRVVHAAAGTISQMARGLFELAHEIRAERSPCRFLLERVPPPPSRTCRRPRIRGRPFISRRTMFAPILPRPTIPSCIDYPCPLNLCALALAIPADQIVGRTVVIERWFALAFQFRNDPLRQHFAQLHAPLVEGIDLPDRALREHASARIARPACRASPA